VTAKWTITPGEYRAVFTNAAGSTTSDPATLHVH
jgi:hypothetical protein